MDEVQEEARGDAPGRLHERELHQLLQLLGALRQQNPDGVLQGRHREQALLEVLILQAHPGAAQHEPLDRIGELLGQAVDHEPAIAHPHHAGPGQPVYLHQPHQALGLERLGPFVPCRAGPPEEHEVRHVHVEVRGEVPDVVRELPHGIGAEAVDEEQRRPGGPVGLRDPAVHHRPIPKLG